MRPITFNSMVEAVSNYDHVIAIREGKAIFLKNRHAASNKEIEPIDFIQMMMLSLPKSGIRFFDDALKEELTNAIGKILFKHSII